jgi:hypothetical protein
MLCSGHLLDTLVPNVCAGAAKTLPNSLREADDHEEYPSKQRCCKRQRLWFSRIRLALHQPSLLRERCSLTASAPRIAFPTRNTAFGSTIKLLEPSPPSYIDHISSCCRERSAWSVCRGKPPPVLVFVTWPRTLNDCLCA